MLYILHFDKPVGRAQHYCGYTTPETFHNRMNRHALGHGARLTAECVKREITMYVARTILDGTPDDERRLKQKRLKDLCPLCCPMLRPLNPEPFALRRARSHMDRYYPVWGWPEAPADIRLRAKQKEPNP